VDYGCAGLDLLVISIEAERALAWEDARWLREFRRTQPEKMKTHAGRIAPLRSLSMTLRRRMIRPRTITRAVRRVAGSLRAIGTAD
jgi:hypothetical protein